MANLSNQIAPHIATDVFGALCVCVREVDFMGWYREERVVGAVLSHGAATPEREASHRIGQRCVAALSERLPHKFAPPTARAGSRSDSAATQRWPIRCEASPSGVAAP